MDAVLVLAGACVLRGHEALGDPFVCMWLVELIPPQAQRVIRRQLAASRQNKIKGQIGYIACRFGFVLEICTFNLSETIFFPYFWVWRILWCKPNLHLKARRRDNDKPKLNYDDENLRCHKICGYMACMAFKMIIFERFRHALTRHDPKSYLPWFVELILLKLKE